MKEKFEQLMLLEDGNITIEERQFKNVHNEIIRNGSLASEFAIEMARKLKEMKDHELYIQAGFNSFGEYVEDAVGIKERQAYNYIKVVEDLPGDFLHSNVKIGITKLLQLTSLSDADRTEVIETVNLEDVSVKELKNKIAELEMKEQQLMLDLKDKENTNDEVDKLINEKEKLIKDIAALKEKNAELNDATKDLKITVKEQSTQIKELKNKTTEVVKEVEKVVEVVDPKITEELEKSNKLLKEKELELEKKEKEFEQLNKQLKLSDAKMQEFKIHFEEFQRVGNLLFSILNGLDEEFKNKCKKAVATVIGGWNHE